MKTALSFLKPKKRSKEEKPKSERNQSPMEYEFVTENRKSASYSDIPIFEDKSLDIEFDQKTKQKSFFSKAFDHRKSIFAPKIKTETTEASKIFDIIDKKQSTDLLDGLGENVDEDGISDVSDSMDEIFEITSSIATDKSPEKTSKSNPATPKFHVRTRTFKKPISTSPRSGVLSPDTFSDGANENIQKPRLKPKYHQRQLSKSNEINMLALPTNKYVPNVVKKESNMRKTDAIKIIGAQSHHYKNFTKFRFAYKKAAFCKQSRVRAQLVKEIYNTEKEYVQSLRTLNEIYYTPLQSKMLIEQENLQSIFGNVPLLLKFQEQFLETMEKQMKEYSPKIGKAFVDFAPYLKVYPEYINDYDENINLLCDLQASKKSFEQFLNKQSMLPECANLSVESFLIKPIQRIPRYKLLLRDLVKETPEYHVDYENLVSAYEKIDHVAGFVNEQKREAENRKVALNLSLNVSPEYQSVLLQPGRKLLKHGTIQMKQDEIKLDSVDTVVDSNDIMIYLFNDFIVLMNGNSNPTQINFEFSIVQIPENEKVVKIFATVLRIRYLFTFTFPEKEFEKWSQMIKSNSERIQQKSSKSADLPIEEFVKLEKSRVEVANRIPKMNETKIKIGNTLKTDESRFAALSSELKANREKLRKMKDLIYQQEIDLANVEEEAKVQKEVVDISKEKDSHTKIITVIKKQKEFIKSQYKINFEEN
eukprot:gene3203-5519_t